MQQAIDGQSSLGSDSIDIDQMQQLWKTIRGNIATLLHGNSTGVTLTTNTASGLHIAADVLQHELEKGDNIVLTDQEFTTNSYVWQQLAKRHNLEIRVVKFNQNLEFDPWSNYIDKNTQIVALSHVQFGNGFRSNLKHISQLVHEQGGYLVVDAIQSLGALPVNVTRDNIDFLAAGGYKWLLGPLGTGLFYINPDLLDKFSSILVGWFSSQDFHEMVHHPFSPWNDARQFQQSFSPYYNALNTSLEQILEWDPKHTLVHINKLQDILLDRKDELYNFKLVTNTDPQHRSGIMKLDHRDAESIVNKLQKQGIIVAYRDKGIRISPHRYNTEIEISRLVDSLSKYN